MKTIDNFNDMLKYIIGSLVFENEMLRMANEKMEMMIPPEKIEELKARAKANGAQAGQSTVPS